MAAWPGAWLPSCTPDEEDEDEDEDEEADGLDDDEEKHGDASIETGTVDAIGGRAW
jgi:hypothetical protein